MKVRPFVAAALAMAASLSVAAAQQPDRAMPTTDSNPRLADIMDAVQSRHVRLWFAGKARNWDLAAYEAAQIRTRLQDAAALYQSLPVTDVTTMATPLNAVSAAVKARDSAKFIQAFDLVTAGCNSCHQAIGRGYIAMQTPASHPFGNQSFAPAKKQP
jgi:uncharacterized membrane protein